MSSDPRTLIGVLRNSHDRLAGLVEPLGPGQLRAQSYDRDWTIAQVLSHLGSGAEIATLNLPAALGGNDEMDREAFQQVWDAWNSRTPEAQAADCLTWDEQHVSGLEALTGDQLAVIRLDLFGRQLDAAGLVRLRLSEHAMHTWDVAVTADPAAVVAPDAVPEILEQITQLLPFVAKPAGDAFRVRLRTTSPDRDYVLDVGEPVTLSDWVDGTEVDGVIELPTEALLRLFYGRLDPEHTPAYTADGVELDRLRKVFPGF
ncbi:MAG TPA: maleylpyruvate isomerase N-terminal domain-containing protein [Streptosporangiaceae bacterium]|nr:maleylpyruvate isomerase N-terminal domain-containing protein [Streptosporangiaceae bacterium]